MNNQNERMKFELQQTEIIGKILGAKNLNLTGAKTPVKSNAKKSDFANAGFKIG